MFALPHMLAKIDRRDGTDGDACSATCATAAVYVGQKWAAQARTKPDCLSEAGVPARLTINAELCQTGFRDARDIGEGVVRKAPLQEIPSRHWRNADGHDRLNV